MLTDTTLHLAGKALSNPEVSTLESINRWDRRRGYALTLGGVRLLLPLGIFCEFISSPVITPLPNSPRHFLGLLNLRGNLLPVYDLSSLWLDYGATAAHINPHVIVLGRGEDAAAMICATPPKTLDLSSAAVGDAYGIPKSIAPFIVQMHTLNGESWFVINFHKVFSWLASAS